MVAVALLVTAYAYIGLAQVSVGSALGLSQFGELTEGAFGYPGIGTRGYGLGFNPNPVGVVLAVVSVFSYAVFLLSRRRMPSRVLALTFFLLFSFGLVATASRSALVGCVLAIAFLSLLALIGGGLSRRTTLKRGFTVIGLIIILAMAAQFADTLGIAKHLGLYKLPSTGFKLIIDRLESGSSSSGIQGRLDDIKLSIPIIRNNLIKGVGAGSYPAAVRKRLAPESSGWKWTPVHNVFMTATAELGIAGGLAWLLLRAAPAIWAFGRVRQMKFEYHALLWIGPLTVVFVESLFDFTPFSTQDGRVLAVAVLGLWAGGVTRATD